MAIPDPTRWRLEQRLELRRHERWPDLREIKVRYRAGCAYVTGTDTDGPISLCRLRYNGSPDTWGFACYLASKDGYEESILPSGSFTGTPEEALDCACGLYLQRPHILDQPALTRQDSRVNFRGRPLAGGGQARPPSRPPPGATVVMVSLSGRRSRPS